MIKEFDAVITAVDKYYIPKGNRGIVLSIINTTCKVEIWNEDDLPVDVLEYDLNELIKQQ